MTTSGVSEKTEQQPTVIRSGHLILGNVTGDEDVLLQGRIEGTFSTSKMLTVHPTGIIKGDVTVKGAVVSGVIVGNITASDFVELTRECRVVGDIRAPRVMIADGARYRGRVAMREIELRREWEKPAPRVESKSLRSVPKPPPPPAPVAAAVRAQPVVNEAKKPSVKPLPPPPPKLERLEAAEGPKKKVVINVPQAQPQGDKTQTVAMLMRAAALYRDAGSNVRALQMLGQAQKLQEASDDGSGAAYGHGEGE